MININAQDYNIIKIIDCNLFEINTGEFIKMGDIVTPSLKDNDFKTKELAREIIAWAEFNFLNKPITIKEGFHFKDTIVGYIMKSRDSDIAIEYLNKGYALYNGKYGDKKFNEYSVNMIFAKRNNLGIWYAENKKDNIQETMQNNLKYNVSSNSYNKLVLFKDPTLAGILSFLFTGTGQVYDTEVGKGILFLVGSYTCYYFSLRPIIQNNSEKINYTWLALGVAIQIWSIIDAVKDANKFNNQNNFNIELSSKGLKINYLLNL
ncbi:MAG: hypothetical protein P4L27_10750 [Ignavibacteriaceae bacterium]|nr:hypothetical protein [Ignavibacteriaceae bacterium]